MIMFMNLKVLFGSMIEEKTGDYVIEENCN